MAVDLGVVLAFGAERSTSAAVDALLAVQARGPGRLIAGPAWGRWLRDQGITYNPRQPIAMRGQS